MAFDRCFTVRRSLLPASCSAWFQASLRVSREQNAALIEVVDNSNVLMHAASSLVLTQPYAPHSGSRVPRERLLVYLLCLTEFRFIILMFATYTSNF